MWLTLIYSVKGQNKALKLLNQKIFMELKQLFLTVLHGYLHCICYKIVTYDYPSFSGDKQNNPPFSCPKTTQLKNVIRFGLSEVSGSSGIDIN